MVRRLSATSLVLAFVAAGLMMLAPAAHAACHVARFVESEAAASEGTGEVSLVVELQGRVGSCAGTVDVATVDGTAVAGEDYEAVTQTLTFEENDDRVETVEITILADDVADAGETFTVELSNPTGGISDTGDPATVTITEDGGQGEEPTTSATVEDGAADDAQDDVVADDADDAEDGSGNLGIIIAVVAAIAIGVGAFALLRGRA